MPYNEPRRMLSCPMSKETTLALKDGRICLSAPKEGRSGQYHEWLGYSKDSPLIRVSRWDIPSSTVRLRRCQPAGEMLSLFSGRRKEEVTVHLLGGANMMKTVRVEVVLQIIWENCLQVPVRKYTRALCAVMPRLFRLH